LELTSRLKIKGKENISDEKKTNDLKKIETGGRRSRASKTKLLIPEVWFSTRVNSVEGAFIHH
jgi:hypothetical protein